MPAEYQIIRDLNEVPEEVLPSVLRQRGIDVPTSNRNIGTPNLEVEESPISDRQTVLMHFDASFQRVLGEFQAFGHSYREQVRERIANRERIPNVECETPGISVPGVFPAPSRVFPESPRAHSRSPGSLQGVPGSSRGPPGTPRGSPPEMSDDDDWQFESVMRAVKDKLQSAFVCFYNWVLREIERGKVFASKLIDTTCQLIGRLFTIVVGYVGLRGAMRHLPFSST